MADNAEVVFKFIDGGSSNQGGSGATSPSGSGPKPAKAKESQTTADALKKTARMGKEPTGKPTATIPQRSKEGVEVQQATKTLSQTLKDTALRIGDSLKKTQLGKVGAEIGRVASALGRTRIGAAVVRGAGAAVRAGGALASGAVRAGGALGGGAARAGAALLAATGPVGAAILAAIAAVALLGVAAKKASDALRGIAEEVGQYSPEFQAAKAKNRAAKTQQDIERAQRFGKRIARQEEVDGRLDRALTELGDDFKEFFAPLADLWTESKDLLASAVEWLAGIESNTDKKKNPHKAIAQLQEKFQQLGSIEGRLKFLNDKFTPRIAGGDLAGDVTFGDLRGIAFEGAN